MKKLLYLFLSAFLALALSGLQAQENTFWVDPAGDDNADGTQAAPFATVNFGLSRMDSGDTLKLNPGMYFENVQTGFNFDFVMAGSITDNPPEISAPSPGPALTLSGNLSRQTIIRGIRFSHMDQVEGTGLLIVDNSATIENCVFLNNFTTDSLGGGLHIRSISSSHIPLIRNNSFMHNNSPLGAALLVDSSAAVISGNRIFENETQGGKGGGLAFRGAYNLNISNNNLHHNQSGRGGAIYMDNRTSLQFSSSLQNNRIYSNSATSDGGGIYVQGNRFSLSLSNNTFAENTAGADGGAACFIQTGQVTVIGNQFIANQAQQHGGAVCLIGLHQANANFWSNQISGNFSGSGGGAVYLENTGLFELGSAQNLQNNLYHNYNGTFLQSLQSPDGVANHNLQYNYWGSVDAAAIFSQINIPNLNSTWQDFIQVPFEENLHLQEQEARYWFGDGELNFHLLPLSLTGEKKIRVLTNLDTLAVTDEVIRFINKSFSIYFDGLNPGQGCELYLAYTVEELNELGNPPADSLKIFYLEATSGKWVRLPSSVDTGQRKVMSYLENPQSGNYAVGVSLDTLFKVYPAPGMTGLPKDVVINIHFEKPLDMSSFDPESVLLQLDGRPLNYNYSYSGGEQMLYLHPVPELPAGADVTVTISRNLLYADGSAFASGFQWHFMTGAFRGSGNLNSGDAFSINGLGDWQLVHLNNDALPDLINIDQDKLRIILNTGGSFGTPLTFSLSNNFLFARPADINADGSTEIILANEALVMAFDWQTGQELDSWNTQFTGQGPAKDLQVADFDNDGLPDVALLLEDLFNDEVRVFLAYDDGGYNLGTAQINVIPAKASSLHLMEADFNGQRDMLVSSGSALNNLALLENSFGSFRRIITDFTGVLMNGVVLTALVFSEQGFGGQDNIIVGSDGLDGRLQIFNVDAGGSLYSTHNVLLGWKILDIVDGDWNGDGRQDLAVLKSNSKISLLLSADFGLQAPLELSLVTNAIALLSSDIDNDEDSDLLLLSESADSTHFTVLLNGARLPRNWYVDNHSFKGDGSKLSPFHSLNEALSRAFDGDSVLVSNGDYPEMISIDEKIILRGYFKLLPPPTMPFSSTLLTIGEGADSCRLMDMTLIGQQTMNTLTGLKISNADSLHLENISILGFGTGMDVVNSSLSFRNSQIQGNFTTGVLLNNAQLKGTQCSFRLNGETQSSLRAGGLHLENNSTADLSFQDFERNGQVAIRVDQGSLKLQYAGLAGGDPDSSLRTITGIVSENNSSLDLQNVFMVDHQGFVISADGGSVKLQNAIFYHNGKNDADAGGAFELSGTPLTSIVNTIFYENSRVFSGNSDPSSTLKFNNFYRNLHQPLSAQVHPTNLFVNPRLVQDYFPFDGQPPFLTVDEAGNPDRFKLAAGSPLIDAGDSTVVNTTASRSDIGLFGNIGTPFMLGEIPQFSLSEVDSAIQIDLLTPAAALESLFRGFVVHRGLLPDFIPDSSNIVAIIDQKLNPALRDTNIVFGQTYFYKTAFVDSSGGVNGYSPVQLRRVDVRFFEFTPGQLNVQVGLEDTLRIPIRVNNAGTLPLTVRPPDILPEWLSITPSELLIPTGSQGNFTLRFSGEGLIRDTHYHDKLNFFAAEDNLVIELLDVDMLVSYIDSRSPLTRLTGNYPDVRDEALLRFTFDANDTLTSSVGTPPELIRYRYRLLKLDNVNTALVDSGTTNLTTIEFYPLADGRYHFQVAGLDTSGNGSIGTAAADEVTLELAAGKIPLVKNFWAMVTPGRSISQLSVKLKESTLGSIKRWQDERYVETSPDSLKPGAGYWLLGDASLNVDLNNLTQNPWVNPVEISLQKGWNMVGNPWGWKISWKDVQVKGNAGPAVDFIGAVNDGRLGPTIQHWQNLPRMDYYRDSSSTLLPMRSYWIFANEALVMTFNPKPATEEQLIEFSGSRENRPASQQNDVLVRIEAIGSRWQSGGHYFGACQSVDAYPLHFRSGPVPPSIIPGLRLFSKSDNKLMSSDFGESPLADEREWTLVVERGEEDKEITLNWDVLVLPASYRFYLYHINSGEWFDLSGRSSFSIENNLDVNYFKLFVSNNPEFEPEILPVKFELFQNYPNPFNPQTTIRVAVPVQASGQKLEVRIYDILGREVRRLYDKSTESGYLELTWDGKNDHGLNLASGVYFYRAISGSFVASKKMVLIR